MANPEASPILIAEHPDADGSHVITIESPEHGKINVRFSEEQVSLFVLTMQRGFLERWEQIATKPQFPLFEVVEVGFGYEAHGTGIMVQTAQSGVWGLIGSPAILLRMKDAIDMALAEAERMKRPPH